MDSWVPLTIGFVVVWLITIGVCRTRTPRQVTYSIDRRFMDIQQCYGKSVLSEYELWRLAGDDPRRQAWLKSYHAERAIEGAVDYIRKQLVVEESKVPEMYARQFTTVFYFALRPTHDSTAEMRWKLDDSGPPTYAL